MDVSLATKSSYERCERLLLNAYAQSKDETFLEVLKELREDYEKREEKDMPFKYMKWVAERLTKTWEKKHSGV